MNGAESLARTLLANDVDVCFANPGTSEMHFVAALDRVRDIRCVLGLFEGVVTGAADGYARIAGRPAATLLHLGPGYANGAANLHDAWRARSPIVNVVGDHATYHRAHDPPLASDIEGLARVHSAWVRTSQRAAEIGVDAAAAVAAARTPPGSIATLILPADTAWSEGGAIGPRATVSAPRAVADEAVERAATLLRAGGPVALLLDGRALRSDALDRAGRIAAATGASLFAPTLFARAERGAGRVPVQRIPYEIDLASALLAPYRALILAGAGPPVAFFAYPGKPSFASAPDAAVHVLAAPDEDVAGALDALVDALGAGGTVPVCAQRRRRDVPSGAITLEGLAETIAAAIPEDAIVVDEAITTGRNFAEATADAAPHDWLGNPGGSIGFALPVSAGAAIAAPGRRVLCLESDGSGMYTPQALWTMARERLDVTVLVFANRAYRILQGELIRVGATAPGQRARDMLEIGRPDVQWTSLAQSMGVPARSVATLDDLGAALREQLATAGPSLIEVVLS